MISILKIMHDKNASWGPLFITNPSTISRDLVFIPHDETIVPLSVSIG